MIEVRTTITCDRCGGREQIEFRYGPKAAKDHARNRGWRLGRVVVGPRCLAAAAEEAGS